MTVKRCITRSDRRNKRAIWKECPTCNGSGETHGKRCLTCLERRGRVKYWIVEELKEPVTWWRA